MIAIPAPQLQDRRTAAVTFLADLAAAVGAFARLRSTLPGSATARSAY